MLGSFLQKGVRTHKLSQSDTQIAYLNCGYWLARVGARNIRFSKCGILHRPSEGVSYLILGLINPVVMFKDSSALCEMLEKPLLSPDGLSLTYELGDGWSIPAATCVPILSLGKDRSMLFEEKYLFGREDPFDIALRISPFLSRKEDVA